MNFKLVPSLFQNRIVKILQRHIKRNEIQPNRVKQLICVLPNHLANLLGIGSVSVERD